MFSFSLNKKPSQLRLTGKGGGDREAQRICRPTGANPHPAVQDRHAVS